MELHVSTTLKPYDYPGVRLSDDILEYVLAEIAHFRKVTNNSKLHNCVELSVAFSGGDRTTVHCAIVVHFEESNGYLEFKTILTITEATIPPRGHLENLLRITYDEGMEAAKQTYLAEFDTLRLPRVE